ncbi:PH domain-containing protein [Deinococcus planocerae]|uniref:PH domain-containing protein n=1 Tax=Deinococcus planocerae TaxID=1737569 RepID=UPI0015E12406|nr:PH domain-containing protein [Deinococcus planocerae]
MSAAPTSEGVPVARPEAPSTLWWVILGVPLVVAGLAARSSGDAVWPLGALAALLAAAFWLAPRRLSYSLEKDALVVTRLTGRTALPYAEITARRSAGRLGVRLFGTGMPGYLTGLFSFGPDAVSRVQAAASRTRGGVIVERGGTAFFLTPADPDAFLRALAARGVRVGA